MTKKTVIAGTLLTASILVTGSALACDAAGPSKHVGQLMSINAAQHTFTIRDAQTQGPITFTANDEIITGLKGANGNIMVNYTEEDDGNLNAVGVSF